MSSRLVGLFVHCLHGDDNQGSWYGKDSIVRQGLAELAVVIG